MIPCLLSLAMTAVSSQGAQDDSASSMVVTDGTRPIPAVVRLYRTSQVIDIDTIPLAEIAAPKGVARLPAQDASWVAVVSAPQMETRILDQPLPDQTPLQPGRTVTVTLADASGPSEGSVTWKGRDRFALRQHTRVDGVTTLNGVPAVSFDVSGSVGAATAKIVVPPSRTRVLLSVAPTVTISGRVLDPRGQPLAGVSIVVEREAPFALREGKTSAGGLFEIRDIPPGRLRFLARLEGQGRFATTLDQQAGEKVRLPTIRLESGAAIQAVLVNGVTGEPIPRARVVEESLSAEGFALRDLANGRKEYRTDLAGTLTLSSLAPGTLQLCVDAPPFARTRLPLAVIPDDGFMDLGIVSLGPGSELRVQVVERNGNPVPRMSVSIDQGPGVSPLDPVDRVTNEDGYASIDRLGKGRYRVTIGGDNRPGMSPGLRQFWIDIDGADNAVVEREVRISQRTVTVEVKQVLWPMDGLQVSISPPSMDLSPTAPQIIRVNRPTGDAVLLNRPIGSVRTGTTDASGVATIENVSEGPVRVGIGLGLATWSTASQVDEDRSRLSVAIPGLTSMVRVASVAGGPVANAFVQWQGQDGTRIDCPSSREGEAALPGVSGGRGQLKIEAKGFEPRTITFASDKDMPREIVLDPDNRLGSISIRVASELGQPVAGAQVIGIPVSQPTTRRVGLTDIDGTSFLDRVHSGQVGLMVVAEGYAPLTSASAEVVAEQIAEKQVVLARGFSVRLKAGAGLDPSGEYSIRVFDGLGQRIDSLLGFGSAAALAGLEGSTATLGPLSAGDYAIELVAGGKSLRKAIAIRDQDLLVEIR